MKKSVCVCSIFLYANCFGNINTSELKDRFSRIESPTERVQLQYCDLMSHVLPLEEAFRQKELVRICEHIQSAIQSVDLTKEEKCRAMVLGILLSTAREQELSFAEMLGKLDPENGLAVAVQLNDSITYANKETTEHLLTSFLVKSKIDYYLPVGYRNRYEIWTMLYGDSIESLQLLQKSQDMGLEERKMWRYASTYWMYDTSQKYPKTYPADIVPFATYFALDQLFLFRSKVSWADFDWYAQVAGIQLRFFYRVYNDATLYYASSLKTIDHGPLGAEKAKQDWLSERNELREILYGQRKEIYELIKVRMTLLDKLIGNDSSSETLTSYLKSMMQGQEMVALNNLSKFDSGLANDLVSTRLEPLIEKEKDIWKTILIEKQNVKPAAPNTIESIRFE